MQTERHSRLPRIGLGALALLLGLIACESPDRDNHRQENAKAWGNETKEESKTQMNEPH